MTEEIYMKSKKSTIIAGNLQLALWLTALLFVPAVFSQSAPQGGQKPPAERPAQKTFATPNDAAKALIETTAKFDVPAVKEILGPDGVDLVSSEDSVSDKNNALGFAAKAQEKKSVTLDPKNPNRATLSVGDTDWPLPVPLV